ncbi:hypothetical protein [Parvularcula maris]|uniref:TonB-dependent receptor plug domain-containing protein n=1 Tax=Parvularcula maris TaxID=2965077 RepID=A0A9X2LAP2_9PROT|nr:hypothetical protein [Parvularcula maris]MCQ8186169.1 hypothetical protein [Parvularcula maris]
MTFRTALAASCLGLLLTAAFAQTGAGEEDGRQVYEPSYFERFAPQTAGDMLGQVPGFSIRQTGGGRGLGQGGTNVLINGRRVTSKDTDVLEILAQTPVASVVRIEVGSAADFSVTGLTGQVANVVIDRSSLTGSFYYSATFREEQKPRLTQGGVSLSGAAGDLSYTVALSNEAWRGTEDGFEERLTPNGELIERRFERSGRRNEAITLTMDLDYPLTLGADLSLTGSATTSSRENRERSIGPEDTRIATGGEDEWNADLSAELTTAIGPGSLKLIGYQRLEHSPITSRSRTVVPELDDEVTTFKQVSDEGESIFRSEYAWFTGGGAAWEAAAEIAYNFLENEADLIDGEGELAIVTPILPRRVDELRTQASLTRGFKIGPKLSVQASLAGEWSRLTVDAQELQREQTFLRPRGSITAGYPVGDRMDIRGRLERTVGQLNFFDFVNSFDLQEQREQTGNTNLVPQQAWLGEFEVERRFGDNEKIIVRVVGELIEDLVQRVLIEDEDGLGNPVFFDAVGNIDEARAIRFETEGTLLTDRFRFEGGRFDFNYTRLGTQLEDSTTGLDRGFNRVRDWEYEVNFRHDVPGTPYAWGADIEGRDDFSAVRFNEALRESESTPRYGIFVEHKDLFGLNLRAAARNLSNREIDLTRTRFAGPRDRFPVTVIEDRTRTENILFTLNLSGNF